MAQWFHHRFTRISDKPVKIKQLKRRLLLQTIRNWRRVDYQTTEKRINAK